MPLDELQKNIAEEARSKSQEIEKAAEKQADEVLSEARKKAKEISESLEKEIKEEIKKLEIEYEASTQMQANSVILAAKEQAAEEYMPKVKALVIEKMGDKQYRKLFDAALEQAIQIAPIERLTLVVNKDDEKFAKGLGARVQYQASIEGGLVVLIDDGKIKIDATVGNLFDRKSDAIRSMVINNMFSSGRRKSAPKEKKVAKKSKGQSRLKKAKR